jgi:hypothetical protein
MSRHTAANLLGNSPSQRIINKRNQPAVGQVNAEQLAAGGVVVGRYGGSLRFGCQKSIDVVLIASINRRREVVNTLERALEA